MLLLILRSMVALAMISASCPAQEKTTTFDLSRPQTLSVGEDPYRICIVDCTGDGKSEIVVTNIGEDTISIFQTGADGIKPVADSPIPAGQQPYSVDAADWDGDGTVDLIISNHQSDRISVLRGLRKSKFTSPEPFQVPTDEHVHKISVGYFTTQNIPSIITERFLISANAQTDAAKLPLMEHYHDYTAADFNGDGKNDIALINGLESRFALLLGDGNGEFSHAEGSPSRAFGEPQSLRLGDRHPQGGMEIIVSARADKEYPAGLFVIRSSGRTFEIEQIDIPLGGIPASINTGDVNGDGKTDIVARLADKAGLTLLRSSSEGFAIEHLPINTPIRHFAIVDVNHDGKDDLAVLNSESKEVLVFSSH